MRHLTTRQDYEGEGIGCSCHINPPCGYCTAPYGCIECEEPIEGYDGDGEDDALCAKCANINDGCNRPQPA